MLASRQVMGAFGSSLALCLLSLAAMSCSNTTDAPVRSTGTGARGNGVGGSASASSGGGASALGGRNGAPGGTGGAANTVGGSMNQQGGTVGQSGGQVGTSSIGGSAGQSSSLPARVLLYSYSIGQVPNLEQQLTIFQAQLEAWQLAVERSEDPLAFTDANLARFGAVMMVNTCGEAFGAGNPGTQEAQALARFVQAGGGLFGTHCASVTFTNLPANAPSPYNQLLGGRGGDGYFGGESTCTRVGSHPTNAALPDSFSYTGDTDNTDYFSADSVVVVKCKWSGNGGKEVNASWYRTEGLGRVFFTTFAKTDADLTNAMLRDQHIFAALAWVLKR